MDKQDLKEILSGVAELLDVKLEERLTPVERRLDGIEGRLGRVEAGQARLEVIIENEIRPNIQLLAEGHKTVIDRLDRIEGDVSDLKEGLLVTQLKVAER